MLLQKISGQKRFQYLNSCVLLYQAAFKGNWQKAKALLDIYPDIVGKPITEWKDTALHIAAAANHPNFVKELLKLMEREDLELQNYYGQTALYFAAASGNVIIAEEMVKKNDKPTLIRPENEMKCTPLYIAALLGRREMVSFLFGKTPFEKLSCGDGGERIELLVATISNNLYDIALRIMKTDVQLATAKDINGKTALYELARKPYAIGSRSQLSVSKRCLNSCLWREVRLLHGGQFSDHVKTFLFEAAKMGNAELLIIVIRSYPDLIWKTDAKCGSIFHIAVLYRQETVFNLIYEIGAIKDMLLTYTDDEDQNILHLAGKLAPASRLNTVSGAALQMQRELLWFKEVQKMVQPPYLQMESKDKKGKRGKKGRTPWDLFTDEHKYLKTCGEKWMKDTANYCMVVAALIATVVFAAAFTLPGGNKGDTGIPVFLKSKWFRVFFISDAVALLCSSTSILMFLSILTSRFAEEDFLCALPGKLVVGLTALFMSIGGMVAAFSATCFLVYESEISWLPIVIIASAGFPVALFVWLHRRLWLDAIHSYWSGLLLGPSKRRFFFFGRKRRLFF
ncbi:hypothetical protein ACB094_07G047500 [Castanea mollissima]